MSFTIGLVVARLGPRAGPTCDNLPFIEFVEPFHPSPSSYVSDLGSLAHLLEDLDSAGDRLPALFGATSGDAITAARPHARAT